MIFLVAIIAFVLLIRLAADLIVLTVKVLIGMAWLLGAMAALIAGALYALVSSGRESVVR